MSKPADTKYYYIVNKETTDDGKLLAVTFNGRGNPVIVTEFERLPTQIWRLRDLANLYEGLQWIEYMDTTIPASFDDDGNVVGRELPDSFLGTALHIRGSEEGLYTIQEQTHRTFWSLRNAEVGEGITGNFQGKKYWRLIPIPIPGPDTESPSTGKCRIM